MSSLLLLMVAMTVTSCYREIKVLGGNSPMVTQVRNQKGFDQIEIWGSPNVYYTQADSFSVEVRGPEDIVDKIQTKVEGHTLAIRNEGKFGMINITMTADDELGVYITSPDLVGIRLNGSGSFTSGRRVDTDNLQIVLHGSGDISFEDIICDHCTTELIGSGDIEINRLEAQTSAASLVGSGDVDVRQWKVRETDIALKGSGDIDVDFVEGCERVTCRLSGSGDITLKGKVNQFQKKKSGSGDIDTSRLSVGNDR